MAADGTGKGFEKLQSILWLTVLSVIFTARIVILSFCSIHLQLTIIASGS